MNVYTYILTVCIALVQGYFLSRWLMSPFSFHGIRIVHMPVEQFIIVAPLTLGGAVAVFLLSAEVINRYGLGNGVAVIIGSFLLFMHIPGKLIRLFMLVKDGVLPGYMPVIVGVLAVGAAYIISEAVSSQKDPVILLDGLEYLIVHNKFDQVLKQLYIIREVLSRHGGILLIPLDPEAFSEKEMGFLEKESVPI